MNTPIACSLSAADQPARRDTIDRIAGQALLSREAIDGGTRLTFAPTGRTEADLHALIAAEAECCPFLTMELIRDGDVLRLDVTGPAEAQPVIAHFFA
jgi:hypothetical protein